MLWKNSSPAPSEMSWEMSQNSMPSPIAATSLPNTTRLRCGVVRNVAVAVWYWNSLVMTRMPEQHHQHAARRTGPDVKIDAGRRDELGRQVVGRGELLLGLGELLRAEAPGRTRNVASVSRAKAMLPAASAMLPHMRQPGDDQRGDAEQPPRVGRRDLPDLAADQAQPGDPDVGDLGPRPAGAWSGRAHRMSAFPAVSWRKTFSRSGRSTVSSWIGTPACSAASPIVGPSAPVSSSAPSPTGST